MIPKIIWQTHNYKYEEIPTHLKKALKTWVNLNPDWDHRYVDHIEREDFVKSRSPQLYDLYLKSRPEAQSDIWRLLALYEFGGVYADMDSICIKPLDYMLQKYDGQDFVSIKKYDSGLINIAHFAVPAKSEVILKIIESSINKPVSNIDWHVWDCFNDHIKHIKKEDQFFDAEIHSKDLKEKFFEAPIDYYGKEISYREYLKDILKVGESEYLQSISDDLPFVRR
jgi:mannosyltransferase OCH1-like enzyme